MSGENGISGLYNSRRYKAYRQARPSDIVINLGECLERMR